MAGEVFGVGGVGVEVRFKPDWDEINEIVGPRGELYRYMDERGRAVYDRAYQNLSGRLVGVQTGFLRDSLFYFIDTASGTPEFRMENNAPYAAYVEQGTAFMEPRGFMEDAMEAW